MRLIDADAIRLPKGFFEKIDNVPKFYDWLDEQPTIDAVPVVRCKDCAYRNGDFCHNYDGFACFDHFFVQMDDYCSRGERMDGEQDG